MTDKDIYEFKFDEKRVKSLVSKENLAREILQLEGVKLAAQQKAYNNAQKNFHEAVGEVNKYFNLYRAHLMVQGYDVNLVKNHD